jgi:hypothetical protein
MEDLSEAKNFADTSPYYLTGSENPARRAKEPAN